MVIRNTTHVRVSADSVSGKVFSAFLVCVEDLIVIQLSCCDQIHTHISQLTTPYNQ